MQSGENQSAEKQAVAFVSEGWFCLSALIYLYSGRNIPANSSLLTKRSSAGKFPNIAAAWHALFTAMRTQL